MQLIVLKDPNEPLMTTGFKVQSISFAPPNSIEIRTQGGERILLIGASLGYIYPPGWTPGNETGDYMQMLASSGQLEIEGVRNRRSISTWYLIAVSCVASVVRTASAARQQPQPSDSPLHLCMHLICI